jgi:chemotaxis protein methyltransferase CheR
VGSDISLRVLQRARTGHYPMERARQVPADYLRRFCLKGLGEQDGTLLVQRALRQRVQFLQVNLNQPLPALGEFDLVFLRNVMIYFNGDTKRQVVQRVAGVIKPGGHLCIGHSESLNDIHVGLQSIAPSIYRKPAHA